VRSRFVRWLRLSSTVATEAPFSACSIRTASQRGDQSCRSLHPPRCSIA
jgi:hypothetical protein